METIEISNLTKISDLDAYSAKWDESKDISIELSENLEDEKIRYLVDGLIKKLPDDFSYALLCDISEIDFVDNDLLMKIFLNGDVACKVSICLRNDLDSDLQKMCNECELPDVRDHINNK